MVMSRSWHRPSQLFRGAIKWHAEQFDGRYDLCGVENRLSVGRPDRNVAASAMKIEDIKEFHDAPVSIAISKFSQTRSVSTHDMRVAVVMLTAHKQ